MRTRIRRLHQGQRGVTLIELLVAMAVFTLFLLMIDAVFSSTRTNSRKTELAADVQQNARVAVDRLTRELREGRSQIDPALCPTLAQCLVVDTTQGPGRHGIVFKSARLVGAPATFCVYVRTRSEPFWNQSCYESFPGTANDVPMPPSSGSYTGPPYPLCAPNTDSTKLPPCGSYQPIWQRYIGYYVEALPDGSLQLRRVTGQLNAPTEALSASLLSGGDVIATMVESFEVGLAANGVVSVALKARGSEVVQGQAIPDQEIRLPGGAKPRN
ncbi:MAG TPA: prepilin-type N-terminal cleavage/methylation domain-containing protein [bacterium]|nr:prepilin-type N-terminal cleavage/methylation domain-containing protein [bacterium]